MYKVTIWVMIQMHYRSYNLIFQINFPHLYLKNANDLDLPFERSWSFSYKINEDIIFFFFFWKMSRFSSIYITVNG